MRVRCATLGASSRTGVDTVIADSILDEGVIRASAEADGPLEVKP